jgi:putative hydrolase of the HAD superfamily
MVPASGGATSGEGYDMGSIRGVLLDSGGVLIRPIGGRWNPRRDFEPTVLEVAPHLIAADFARAIDAGERFFETSPPDATRDDYHRALLDEIDVPATEALLSALGRPLEPSTIVEPFPDVMDVLHELRERGLRLGCVTDNGPGIERLHEGLGIREFFEVYAISAVLGCTKPDRRMFHHASETLGLRPEECLFVDDVAALVVAAGELGYHGAALEREGPTGAACRSIGDLAQVLELI